MYINSFTPIIQMTKLRHQDIKVPVEGHRLASYKGKAGISHQTQVWLPSPSKWLTGPCWDRGTWPFQYTFRIHVSGNPQMASHFPGPEIWFISAPPP